MPTKLVQAIRLLCEAVEAGPVNAAQREAIRKVRVILGDEKDVCLHPLTVYETIDKVDNYLVCQACREVVETPKQDANLIQLTR